MFLVYLPMFVVLCCPICGEISILFWTKEKNEWSAHQMVGLIGPKPPLLHILSNELLYSYPPIIIPWNRMMWLIWLSTEQHHPIPSLARLYHHLYSYLTHSIAFYSRNPWYIPMTVPCNSFQSHHIPLRLLRSPSLHHVSLLTFWQKKHSNGKSAIRMANERIISRYECRLQVGI